MDIIAGWEAALLNNHERQQDAGGRFQEFLDKAEVEVWDQLSGDRELVSREVVKEVLESDASTQPLVDAVQAVAKLLYLKNAAILTEQKERELVHYVLESIEEVIFHTTDLWRDRIANRLEDGRE